MTLLRAKVDIEIITAKHVPVAEYEIYLPQKLNDLRDELGVMISKHKHEYAKYPRLKKVSYNGTELHFYKTDLMTINRVIADLDNVKKLYGIEMSGRDINRMLAVAGTKTDGSTATGKLIKGLYTGKYVDNHNRVQFTIDGSNVFLNKNDPIVAHPASTDSYHKKHYEISDGGAFHDLEVKYHIDDASLKTMLNVEGWQIVETSTGYSIVAIAKSVRKAADLHVEMAQFYDHVRADQLDKEKK